MKRTLVLTLIFSLASVFLFAQEEVWFAKGEQAYNRKDFENAENFFTKAIELKKDFVQAYYFRGLSRLYLGKIKKALRDFDRTLALDSNVAEAFNNRGLCYGYIGEVDKSIEDFKKAIKLDSSFAEAYLNLASAYLAKNDFKKAERLFTKAAKIDSTNPETRFLRGTVYYVTKKFKKAVEDFTKSINLGFKNSRVYYNRANAYFNLGNYLKAIDDYSRVLENDSLDADALNNRSIAYLKIGNETLAKRDRLRLALVKANLFKVPPLDSIKYKTVFFPDSRASIELPADWNAISDSGAFGKIKIVSKDKIDSVGQPYYIGARAQFDTAFAERYKVKTADEILKFWEKSSKINRKEMYESYENLFKKPLTYGKYKGFFNEARLKIKNSDYFTRLFEIVLAKDDALFFAYFQAPELVFPRYRKIFERCVKTLKFNY